MRATAFLLLAFGGPVLAAGPTVTAVPASAPVKWVEFRAAPGRQLVLSADEPATWTPADDGFDLTPDSDGRRAVFTAPVPGPYRVLCTTKAGTTHVRVAVGDGPTPPPDPKPDALRAKLLAAYAADADPEKREHAKDLAELYRQAAGLAAKPDVATSGDLLARVRAASTTLVGIDALKAVRAAVATELAAVLPADALLTPEQRVAATTLFKKLAEILDTF